MIRIKKDLIVMEPLEDVLYKLQQELLEKTGKLYFSRRKRAHNSLMVSCPWHKQGMEKKPSCGIIYDTGVCHCFTCGTIASLTETISHLFLKTDNGEFGEKWLVENCTIARFEQRDLGDFPQRERKKEKIEYITEEELEKYRVYHDYMFKRGLTEDIIERYDVGFDPDFRIMNEDGSWSNKIPCLTFPVRDKTGGTVFIARRSVEGKLFYYPPNVNKPVYGIYELYRDYYIGDVDGKFYYLKKLLVVESIINALTGTKYGIPGCALLGTGTFEQFRIFRRLPVENIYLGFDGDEAGRKATMRFLKYVPRINIFILDIPEGKDVNDLTEKEFNSLKILTPEEWKSRYIF